MNQYHHEAEKGACQRQDPLSTKLLRPWTRPTYTRCAEPRNRLASQIYNVVIFKLHIMPISPLNFYAKSLRKDCVSGQVLIHDNFSNNGTGYHGRTQRSKGSNGHY